MSCKNLVCVVVLFVSLNCLAARGATIVKPVGATASTELSPTYAAGKTIDATGLSSDLITGAALPGVYPTHNTTATNMWLMPAVDPTPNIVFDLGAQYDLTGFHVWNYNETGFLTISLRDVTVSFSNTSALTGFSSPEVFTGASEFAMATGLGSYTGENKLFAALHSARWVKFSVGGDWGNPSYQGGLSEVRFFGDLYVAPPVPEPATLSLLGLGALLVVRRARRQSK